MNRKRPTVTIYKLTGRQLFFVIPEAFCEECDLTVVMVRRVLQELGDPDVRLKIRPWINNLFQSLLKGGRHAPVVVIDGKLFSQGVVPAHDALLERMEEVLKARGLVGAGAS